MNLFWEIIASNAIVATVLAICIMLLSPMWKNPAAIHLLWVVVLLKLFMPPIITAQTHFAVNWLPSADSSKSVDKISPSFTLDVAKQAVPGASINLRGTDHPYAAANTHHAQQDQLNVATDSKLLTILTSVWICGSSCIALVYVFQICRFASLLKKVEPSPQVISRMVTQFASRLGLRRIPNVLMTSRALPPLVWSLGGRPRLILPSELFARLSGNAQAMILAHELTHVCRRDDLVRLLELVATTLFWWHPVVWWACSRLRDLEEQCCDSRVLELVPDQARTYAAALVDTLEFLSEHPRVPVLLSTAAYSTGSLSRRIRMLTKNRTNRLSVLSAAFVVGIVAVPLVVVLAADVPEPTNKIATPAHDSAAATGAILGGRVTNEASEPLAEVRVRVAIPATEMRFVDSSTEHKLFETKSDVNGEYRLELPEITIPTTISIDAMKPGYRKLAGTLMGGGDARYIEVAPGVAAEASFALKPSLYLAGIIVDESGKPVVAANISANARYARSSGGVERTVSNSDGSFELFNYSIKPFAHGDNIAKGAVGFSHPDYVSSKIDDIYALPQNQREALRIKLLTGLKISGTVLDVTGQPVSNVMIKATRKNGSHRKATMTDARGKFVLRGLVEGATTLRVHALDLKQKIKLSLDLDSNKKNFAVQLQEISLSVKPKAISVLGMQLTDVTPELQAAYDLHNERGALILDPGKDFERLEIGKLAEGNIFWLVGEKRINSVREFINQILAEASTQDTDVYSIRVVYNFSRLNTDGSNTQYLKLVKDDLEHLRKILALLTDDS